jgi:hypothetical protein
MTMRHAIIAALAAGALALPVSATDLDWSLSGDGYHQPRKIKKTRRHVKREPDKETVRLYRSMEEEGVVCVGKVRGLGTQWIGTEGALDAAKKDFMERVRYDYGEAFLDLSHAKDFISRCGRTSIGETMGQVMYRCEIIARPCKAKFVEGAATGK